MKRFAAIAGVCLLAGVLLSQSAPREQVGPLASGGFLLKSGWKLTPAGTQIEVGTFPMSSALSKDGRFLVVLNAGVEPPSLSMIDIGARKEISRTPVEDGWLGLVFNPKGDRLYVGGGAHAAIYEFSYSDGKLAAARTFFLVDTARRTYKDFTGDLAFTPDGRLLYATDLYHDALTVINPLSGVVIEKIRTGRRPYRILFQPDGNNFYVTSWADGTVAQFRTSDNNLLSTVRLGPHPTDMVWRHSDTGNTIFVAAANTNSVYSVAVSESGELSRGQTISVAMYARQPLGMTPNALAMSADAKTLWVACSDANAVGVIDLTQERWAPAGFIPSGLYPTAVRALPDGTVAVLNGHGVPSASMGTVQKGSVEFIATPDEAQLTKYSQAVLTNAAYTDAKLDAKPMLPPGIKHVVLIVNENGSSPAAQLEEAIMPNQHKLAREFVLLDNFYAMGNVGADGVNWSTAAVASDYVQKLWPAVYGRRRAHYDFEGGEPAALPPAGYLWNNAALAGISVRNYGFFVENAKVAGKAGETQVAAVRDQQLAAVTDMEFRGPDPDYPDADRAKEFVAELKEMEQAGKFSQLSILRLGGGEGMRPTAGSNSDPRSAAADNDLAIGMVIEALSRSKFWNETALFIVPPVAGNGLDHAGSSRSPAFVVSPFVKRHFVDSTMYNTMSVLRTTEVILGLRPMTQFDAGARVMTTMFQTTAEGTPFVAEQAH